MCLSLERMFMSWNIKIKLHPCALNSSICFSVVFFKTFFATYCRRRGFRWKKFYESQSLLFYQHENKFENLCKHLIKKWRKLSSRAIIRSLHHQELHVILTQNEVSWGIRKKCVHCKHETAVVKEKIPSAFPLDKNTTR